MPNSPSSASQSPRAPQRAVRVSLACVPCRSQHLKCDAVLPTCARCRTDERQCVYSKSRRGRPRRNPPLSAGSQQAVRALGSAASAPTPAFTASQSPTEDGQSSAGAARFLEALDELRNGVGSTSAEQLVSLYYSFFHPAHPCLLPQHAMRRYLSGSDRGGCGGCGGGGGGSLELLHSVMQYIGSLFAPTVPSAPLKAKAEIGLALLRTPNAAISPFDVQAVLLYAIAAYWSDALEKAKVLIDEAIRMALALGMHQRGYAVEHGQQDPVLEESWRRTWWQIYVTDAFVAGGTRRFPFRTSYVEMDVDLPCEEQSYELGHIPSPRTLSDYEMREFLENDGQGFSSFAELVGLTRSFDLALIPMHNTSDVHNIAAASTNVDAAATAWRALLPSSKKCLQQCDGSVDEILFEANALIFAYSTGLHRRLSMLAFDPVEAGTRCPPPPRQPERLPGYSASERQLHTSKTLAAVDRFNELLVLPTNLVAHTPFIICMIANVVKTQLSACRYVYSGQKLQLARERIRVSMGSLKVLGEYWPLGERTYRELGAIAREILFSAPVSTSTSASISSVSEASKSPQSTAPEPEPPQPPISVAEQLPMYLLSPDNAFEFGELYDMNFSQAIDSVPPIL